MRRKLTAIFLLVLVSFFSTVSLAMATTVNVPAYTTNNTLIVGASWDMPNGTTPGINTSDAKLTLNASEAMSQVVDALNSGKNVIVAGGTGGSVTSSMMQDVLQNPYLNQNSGGSFVVLGGLDTSATQSLVQQYVSGTTSFVPTPGTPASGVTTFSYPSGYTGQAEQNYANQTRTGIPGSGNYSGGILVWNFPPAPVYVSPPNLIPIAPPAAALPGMGLSVNPPQGYPGMQVELTISTSRGTTGNVSDGLGWGTGAGSVDNSTSQTVPYTIPTTARIGQVITITYSGSCNNIWTGGSVQIYVVNPMALKATANPSTLAPTETSAVTANTSGIVTSVNGTGSVINLNDVSIAEGKGYTTYVKADGTVWSSGNNAYGVFGNGTTNNSSTFVQMQINYAQKVVTGDNFTAILKKDGTVWAVGYNNCGQLGDGTTTNRLLPVRVAGITDVTDIAADGDFLLMLKKDGTVWGVGDNSGGQLGIGNTVSPQLSPVQMQVSNITQISAGLWHSSVLDKDGHIWYCGDVEKYGIPLGHSTPVEVTDLAFTSTYAGGIYYNYTYYAKPVTATLVTSTDNTTVFISNASGGYFSSQGNSAPTASYYAGEAVTLGYPEGELSSFGGISYYTYADLQYAHNNGYQYQAVQGESTLGYTCWVGYTGYGEPYHTTTVYPDMIAGHYKSLVLHDTSTGNIIGYGGLNPDPAFRDYSGNLVYGGQILSSNGGTPLLMAIGSNNIAMLTSQQSVILSGDNTYGQLGNGTTTSTTLGTYVTATQPMPKVIYTSSGSGNNIITLGDGSVWGIGLNSYGQLGNGNTVNSSSFVKANVANVKKAITDGNATFFLTNDGNVYGVGYNGNGQLGTGDTTNRTSIMQLPISGVVDIDYGSNTLIMVKQDGSVWYSGWFEGTTCSTITQIPGMSQIIHAYSGNRFVMAVRSDGTVWSIGYNQYGEFGLAKYGTNGYYSWPSWYGGDGWNYASWYYTPVQMAISNVKSIVLQNCGLSATLLTNDGHVYTTGLNRSNDDGSGNYLGLTNYTIGDDTPQLIASNVSSIFGMYGGFGLVQSGSVYVWGNINYNSSQSTNYTSLTPFPSLPNVTVASFGWWNQESFIDANGNLYLGGADNYGQLNNGLIDTSKYYDPIKSTIFPLQLWNKPQNEDDIQSYTFTPTESPYDPTAFYLKNGSWIDNVKVPADAIVGGQYVVNLSANSGFTNLNGSPQTATTSVVLQVRNAIVLSPPISSKYVVNPGDTVTITVPNSSGYALSVLASGPNPSNPSSPITANLNPSTSVASIPKYNTWTGSFTIPNNAPQGAYVIMFQGFNNVFTNQPPSAPVYLNLTVGSPPVSISGNPTVTPDPVYSHLSGSNVATLTLTTRGAVDHVSVSVSGQWEFGGITSQYVSYLSNMNPQDSGNWLENYQVPDNVPDGTLLTFSFMAYAANGYAYGPVYATTTADRLLSVAGQVSDQTGLPGSSIPISATVTGYGNAVTVTDGLGNSVDMLPGDSPNLLANGSFERDTSGWSLVPQAARTNTTSYLGAYSLQLVNPTQGQSIYNVGSIQPSTTYTVGVWAASTLGNGTRINVVDTNNGTWLDPDVNNVSIPVNGGAWKLYYTTITTQPNANGLTLRLISDTSQSGTAYYDGFFVVQGSTPPPATITANSTWSGLYTIPSNVQLGQPITLTFTPTDTVDASTFTGATDQKVISAANTPAINGVTWNQESPYPGAATGSPTGVVDALINTSGYVNSLSVSWDNSYSIPATSYVDLGNGTRQWTVLGLTVPANADVSNAVPTVLHIKAQTPWAMYPSGQTQTIYGTGVLPIQNNIKIKAQQLTNPVVTPGTPFTITATTTGYAAQAYAKNIDGSLITLSPQTPINGTNVPFNNTWTGTITIPPGTSPQIYGIPVYATNTVFLNQPPSNTDYVIVDIGGVPSLFSASLTPYVINLPAATNADRTVTLDAKTTGQVSGVQISLSINGATPAILPTSTMVQMSGTVPNLVSWEGSYLVDPNTPDKTKLTFTFQALDTSGHPTGQAITLNPVLVNHPKPPLVVITH